MSQPEINIGTAGHVDHGKTTLLQRLTGKWADVHSESVKRGITIKLGYADAQIYRCDKCDKLITQKKCSCGGSGNPVRKVSFVDAPGHETLMATMLSGAATMDGALLLIAANEGVQPQTREHLMALEILGVGRVIIIQNKVDLVSEEQALENFKAIKDFVKGTIAENAPIIPISAQHGANIDILLEMIEKHIPTPKLRLGENPLLIIARSFDVNKPGSEIEKIKGGVIGGVLVRGTLTVGDVIEIMPGFRDDKGKFIVLESEVVSITSAGESLKSANPGGSLGVGTNLDMFLTKSDRLAGNVAGHKGKLPPVHENILLEVHLMQRMVGASKEADVDNIKINDLLMLNAWTSKTLGVVSSFAKNGNFILNLKLPICIDYGEKVAISRRVDNRWRLVGYGVIKET